ncbi:MAG TPA: DUF1501 domain-containing protein [Gemmatimonadaceae bacterium]|nr:DUF1501 domain-containing protein [Gemmatimonadaceae bacterium]
MHRRVFVKSGALALVTMGLSPSFLKRAIYAQARLPSSPRGKVLICLFQRGAADALNVVVPHGEAQYYSLRPSIAIPRPTSLAAGPALVSRDAPAAIDLDGFFGLHPALAPLKPLWDRRMLAPIVAVGSPSATRSHFDAQDFMETGTPDVKATSDGWLNRYLAAKGTCAECDGRRSPFEAVAFSPQTPRILEGPAPSIAMTNLAEFSIRATGTDVERLEALYRTGSADLVHGTGAETFDAVKMLRAANPAQYLPQHDAEYPSSPFGQSLRQIAQLIKSDVGVEIAFADVGGWDTHVNEGSVTGQLASRLRDFSQAIAALVADLDDRMGDVVILTMSEFGRMAKENGTGGTDHGHAGAMFVIGGSVHGGRVYGRWPGLAPEQLYEGRDLALTTDFRTVFSEVVMTQLGAVNAAGVFPGFTPTRRLGLL